MLKNGPIYFKIFVVLPATLWVLPNKNQNQINFFLSLKTIKRPSIFWKNDKMREGNCLWTVQIFISGNFIGNLDIFYSDYESFLVFLLTWLWLVIAIRCRIKRMKFTFNSDRFSFYLAWMFLWLFTWQCSLFTKKERAHPQHKLFTSK